MPEKSQEGSSEVDSQCANCKGQRRHRILTENRITEYSDEISYWADLQIVECAGCQHVSFRKVEFCSEWLGHEGELEPSITFLPEIDEREAKNFENLPRDVELIYHETLAAFNKELFFLCSAGMRAIVEGVCGNLGVTGGPAKNYKTGSMQRKQNLEGKINGLYEGRHLTKVITTALHNTRALGNEALHELVQPTKAEVSLSLDVIEHALASLYQLDSVAEKARYLRRVRVRGPVEVVSTWNPVTNKASITWQRSVQRFCDGYELRYCPGNSYDKSREVLVLALPKNQHSLETDHGLSSAGAVALFKLYSIISGSQDNGSEVIRIERT